MRFSGCCITRSSIAVLLLLAGLYGTMVAAQESAPIGPDVKADNVIDSTSPVVDANRLQREGNPPFHLKVTFQVFDLKGKPSETGDIEYWWAGPDGFHLNITSPSLGVVHNSGPEHVPTPEGRRVLYLATQLLGQVRDPGAVLDVPQSQVVSERRMIGTVALECMHTVPPSGGPPGLLLTYVCSDPQTPTIRFVQTPQYTVARNRTATFGTTHIAQDLVINYGHVQAIQGKVILLQGFRPAEATVALQKLSPTPAGDAEVSSAGAVRLPGGVIAGSKISGSAPSYPFSARQLGITGSVVLLAEITKEGNITGLVPLASPDASLTEAATSAVSKWTYKPYLLNGVPTNVLTTVTVNFAFNVRSPH